MSVATVNVPLGTNARLVRPLVESDGATPLLCSALVVCAVDLYQGGKLVRTLVRGTDPELRNGTDGHSLILELTRALRASLKKGLLTEVWLLGISSADYEVDDEEDVKGITIEQVILT